MSGNLVAIQTGDVHSDRVNDIETQMWLRIGEEIKRQGMSLKGFAAKACVDPSTIIASLNKAKAGECPSDIKISTVFSIAAALNKSVNWVVHGIESGDSGDVQEEKYVDFLLKRIFSSVPEKDYASKLVGMLALLSPGQREAVRQHILNLIQPQ